MNTVTVIGSINMDATLRLANMPKSGKTIHAHKIFRADGGKGASQAAAAKRSDARTSFIGSVGTDSGGQQLSDLLIKENIDTSGIVGIQGATAGQAMIVVDAAGENSISVRTGASNVLHEQEVLENKQLITNNDFIIAQPKSSLNATILAFSIAEDVEKTTVLNPAPTRETTPIELFEKADIVISSETETEIIIGVRVADHNSLVAAVEKLHESGIGTVIVTPGNAGTFYHTEKEHGTAFVLKVDVTDTTAAGDTFIGTLSSVLQPDLSNLKEAVPCGNLTSFVAVQSYGAQPSVLYRETLEQSTIQD